MARPLNWFGAWFGACVLAGALVGCSSQPAGDAQLETGGAGDLMNGTGFAAVADGTMRTLVYGAQGGFHEWINVRVTGVSGPAVLEIDARRVSDGALILRGAPQSLAIPDAAMSTWWSPADATPAFMCPSPVGIQIWGQEIDYDARLTDGDGNAIAEDDLVMIPLCPDDNKDFCLQICSG